MKQSDAEESAFHEISQWPGYAPTPLVNLRGLALRVGVGNVWCKDEGPRFGLGSFKAVGGAYAVFRHLARKLEALGHALPATLAELRNPKYRAALGEITVTCATAGNHGRAVAWGAQLCGCSSVVFIPAGAGESRAAALAALGARVITVRGSYDDALAAAIDASAANGWDLISDTSAGASEAIAADVMAGYGVIFREVAAALPIGEELTHVFVQAGVGSLAAAACSFASRISARAPTVIVVEPDSAACLAASANAGALTHLDTPIDTIMGGLACAAPSPLAWKAIAPVARFYISISDDATREAMTLLECGEDGDSALPSGPSGAAGVAGLLAACEHASTRKEFGLTASSSVLVISTELTRR